MVMLQQVNNNQAGFVNCYGIWWSDLKKNALFGNCGILDVEKAI